MRHTHSLLLLLLGTLLLAGCNDSKKAGDDDMTGEDGGVDIPFEPVGPRVYVPKVKNLLTGLPASDEEINKVIADPNALRGLIDQWMTLPEFETREMAFFKIAFQQKGTLGLFDHTVGLYPQFQNISSEPKRMLEQNLQESFSRTVIQLLKEGRPLNEAITTRRYMMTTAMMSMYAYVDEVGRNDGATDYRDVVNHLVERNAITSFTIDPRANVTLQQTLDPSNANYMLWKTPVTIPAACTTPAGGTYRVTYTSGSRFYDLYNFIMGGGSAYPPCDAYYPVGAKTQKYPSQFADSDWNDWRMVTIVPTSTGTPNTTPVFYDILKLRAATTMALHVPRVGFFGTVAFQSQWATNDTNEARVTANQTLIVAIGRSINGENSITNIPANVSTNDASHASDPACMGCHQQLDPFKQYFRQSYSLFYHDQRDTTQLAQQASFNIDGVGATGQGVGDLAATLAAHPRFGIAWSEKLYNWAMSVPALEDDPELVRIADAFRASNYDFHTLVREMFSSPLVTLASGTKTTQANGVINSIVRRDQYCAALSQRLQMPDICGLDTRLPTPDQGRVSVSAVQLPADTYFRAFELASLPTESNLFFRAGVERMCAVVAMQAVDRPGGGGRYKSTDVQGAISDFVSNIMGIAPGDLHATEAAQILQDHFTSAKAAGASSSDALRSTFTLACIAPTTTLVGL